MKKTIQFGLMALSFLTVCTTTTFAQKKVKEGVVKFEMKMDGDADSPEMAMMGNMSLDFYFSKTQQRMDMSMMGGMMRIQTFVPIENPKDGCLLMDMMGKKYQIVELKEEELSQSNSFMNMDNVEEVVYDEKDTKEIAGYKCYRASLTGKDGSKMKYYITEKIAPPAGVVKKDAMVLKGYPLEMEIDTGQGMKMTFEAKEILTKLPENVFGVPDGYEKMTMEEFEKSMGDLDLGH